MWDLAGVHRFKEEYNEAEKLYSEALQIRTEIGDRRGRGLAVWGLAQVHRARREYKEAIKLFSEAKQTFIDAGDKDWISVTVMDLAQTNHMGGHFGEAISFYMEASEVLEETRNSRRATYALENAANIRKMLIEVPADAAERVEAGED